MKKPFIYLLSAALVAAGCTKGAKAPREYAPLAPKDALVLSVRDMAAMRTSPMFDYVRQWAKRQQEAAVTDSNGDNTPEAARKFAETIGGAQYADILEKACAREKWSVITVGPLPFTLESLVDNGAQMAIPAIAVVEATREPTTTEDSLAFFETVAAPYRTLLDELFDDDGNGAAEKAEMLAKIRNAFEVATDTVAGCEVRKFTLKRTDDTAEFLDHVSGFEPCFGVFDGALEIFASSPQVFADTVALYSGSAEAAPAGSAIARDAALKDGSHFIVGAYGISKAISEFAGDRLDEAPEEAARYLASIGDLRITGKYDSSSIVFGASLSFGDDTLPQLLAGICNGGIGMAKAAVSMSALQMPELAPVAAFMNGVTAVADGKECKFAATVTKDFLEKLDVPAIRERLEASKPGQGEEDDLFGGNGENGGGEDADDDK